MDEFAHVLQVASHGLQVESIVFKKKPVLHWQDLSVLRVAFGLQVIQLLGELESLHVAQEESHFLQVPLSIKYESSQMQAVGLLGSGRALALQDRHELALEPLQVKQVASQGWHSH